jgi:rhodanese-related sulfurtransferase
MNVVDEAQRRNEIFNRGVQVRGISHPGGMRRGSLERGEPMRTQVTRRILIVAALLAAVALPLTALWAASERPALDNMLSAVKSKITEITVADGKALFDKGGYTWVDVRTDPEFKAGHLPGAKSLDRGLMEFNVEKAIPDKAAPIVVYCKTGGRAALATATLAEMGYTNVKSMNGGFMDWEKAAYPIEK